MKNIKLADLTRVLVLGIAVAGLFFSLISFKSCTAKTRVDVEGGIRAFQFSKNIGAGLTGSVGMSVNKHQVLLTSAMGIVNERIKAGELFSVNYNKTIMSNDAGSVAIGGHISFLSYLSTRNGRQFEASVADGKLYGIQISKKISMIRSGSLKIELRADTGMFRRRGDPTQKRGYATAIAVAFCR